MSEIGNITEMDMTPASKEKLKPASLYHASRDRNLTLLTPRAETVRDPIEGPVVFATPDKGEASKFLVPSDDTWTKKMKLNGVNIHVISDRKRYKEADVGGSIYQLKPDTFENDETKGTKTEWTSNVAVSPLAKEDYESGLTAQIENGVQVYFVDKTTFDNIQQSSDHGENILKGLIPENREYQHAVTNQAA